MKQLFLVLALVVGIGHSAYAVAEVPTSSVWFEPATAQAGEAIQLNALVYNNQTVDATVTVVFSTPAGTIGTTSSLITKGAAKTVTVDWKMPAVTTVVTATVSTAVTSAKKSLPGLVGDIGTVSIGTATPTSTVLGLSFPGSAQLAAWFGPVFSKVERWRLEQKDYFISLQTDAQKKLGMTDGSSLDIKTLPAKIIANPGGYLTFYYAASGVSLFSSQALFYIVCILLFLLLLRFVVNRFA